MGQIARFRSDLAAFFDDDPVLRTDLKVCGYVWLGLFAVAFVANWPTPSPLNMAFGYEYGDVAESLARGEGFANPFGGHTGPTAWMPPMFCWILALNFAIFGIKTTLALWVAIGIKYAMFTASLFILMRLALTTGYGRFRHLLVAAMLLPAMAFPTPLFWELHDVECVTLLSVLLLTVIYGLWRHGHTALHKTRWMLAILLPLTHPGLSIVFVVFMVAYAGWCLCVRFRGNLRRAVPDLRAVVITGLLFCGSAGFWTLRNALVFHAFIPIKSNFWYEWYQVNVQSDQGVVTNSVGMLYHPIHSKVSFSRYQSEGEIAFLHHYELLSRKANMTRAEKFRRLLQRAGNALLFLRNQDNISYLDVHELSPGDMHRLIDAHLIVLDSWTHYLFWTCVDLAPADFAEQLPPLQLQDPALVSQVWTDHRESYLDRRQSWTRVVDGIAVTSAPVSLALLALCFSGVRREPLFWIAGGIYGLYLTPYILVSHYTRYQLPMVGIQSVFTFFGTAAVLQKVMRHRQDRKEPQLSIEDLSPCPQF